MSRQGFATAEMLAGIIMLGLIATITGGAYAGVRQRQATDQASARLEEAQNLLARWRAGGEAAGPGWSISIDLLPGAELLELRGDGVRLSTLRPLRGGGR